MPGVNPALLAAFANAGPTPGVITKGINGVADALGDASARAQQQSQFDARQVLQREQDKQAAQQAAAQLGEAHTYHQGALDIQQQGLDAEQRERAANAAKMFAQAAGSGKFEEAKALIPYLQMHGVDVHELAGAAGAMPDAPPMQLDQPGTPPSLSAFQDMPHLQAPALQAPPPAPVGQSGNFGMRFGEQDLGSVDLAGMQEAQRAQFEPMLRALTKGRPQDNAARTMAADALVNNPQLAANPEKGLDAFSDIVNPQLNRQTSEVNAANMRLATSQNHGTSDRRQAVIAAGQRQKVYVDGAYKQFNIKGIEDQLAAADKVEALISSGNALAGREAVLQNLKAIIGGRITDHQLDHALKAGGIGAQFETEVNKWFDEGKLSAQHLAMLRKTAIIGRQAAKANQIKAARAVSDGIRNDSVIGSLTPELAESLARSGAQSILGSPSVGPADKVQKVGETGDGGDGGSVSVSASGAALGQPLDDQIDSFE